MNQLVEKSRVEVTINDINLLLGTQYTPTFNNPNTVIGRQINEVFVYHLLSDTLKRDKTYTLLVMLVKHLVIIKGDNEKAFKEFKHLLISYENRAINFKGIRFEVAIASSLCKRKINFVKQDSPDFKILEPDSKFLVECTSLNQTEQIESVEGVREKIYTIIKKKESKDYAKKTTILFIDITFLIHNFRQNNIHIYQEINSKKFLDGLNKTKFGAIVLFTYLFEQNTSLKFTYTRKDFDIPNDIELVLNRLYPIGYTKNKGATFPKNG